MEYEPRILGFLCNWCSYSAADAAGAAKRTYPPNVQVVRVMCTGRVDPTFVLQALRAGMDGVLVCGCHPGDCHYISGNCKALGRFQLVKQLLTDLGVEPERIRLEWISASEGERYAEVVGEVTEHLRKLGPLKWPDLLADAREARSGGEAPPAVPVEGGREGPP